MHSSNQSIFDESSQRDELFDLGAKAAAIAGGIAVAYEVFRHRRLISAVAVCAGTAMLVKRCFEGGGCARRARSVGNLHLGSPSFPGENIHASTQEPMDEIDEAMMESFPASDPPASYRR
jgi:hypothetical protein